jgi:hypothetical protein
MRRDRWRCALGALVLALVAAATAGCDDAACTRTSDCPSGQTCSAIGACTGGLDAAVGDADDGDAAVVDAGSDDAAALDATDGDAAAVDATDGDAAAPDATDGDAASLDAAIDAASLDAAIDAAPAVDAAVARLPIGAPR